MSRQIKRKEFPEFLEFPLIRFIPVAFKFTQNLNSQELFILDPGDVDNPVRIQLHDIYQSISPLYAKEAFTDSQAARRFERDVKVITLRVGYESVNLFFRCRGASLTLYLNFSVS